MAMLDLGTMQIDHVESINNVDTIALVAFIDMGLCQFSRCPSASTNEVQQADLDICRGWIDVFKQHFDAFSAVPQLYLPKAHPKAQKLPAPPVVKIVQNPMLQHMMYQLSALRTELLYAEDAERLNGYHSQTSSVVVLPWIAKFEGYLNLIGDNIDPKNAARTFFPESDLQEPGVNPGEPR